MYTTEQINSMSKEELDKASRKLAAKLVLTHVVIPLAVGIAVNVASKLIANKLSKNETVS